MKNWLKFEYGTYINGIEWKTEGMVYIDPAAISSVMEISRHFPNATGCCIYLGYSGKQYAVRESISAVMAEIQSAL